MGGWGGVRSQHFWVSASQRHLRLARRDNDIPIVLTEQMAENRAVEGGSHLYGPIGVVN